MTENILKDEVIGADKLKGLFDTDLGSDCDDASALLILNCLADEGRAEILATTHCASEIGGSVTIKVINDGIKDPIFPLEDMTHALF